MSNAQDQRTCSRTMLGHSRTCGVTSAEQRRAAPSNRYSRERKCCLTHAEGAGSLTQMSMCSGGEPFSEERQAAGALLCC